MASMMPPSPGYGGKYSARVDLRQKIQSPQTSYDTAQGARWCHHPQGESATPGPTVTVKR